VRPTDDLDHVRAATGQLFRTLERLSDGLAVGPSALPGWTRGHVLSHIARNAEATFRVVDAALEQDLVPMYEGGREARSRAIEEGAGRPARVLADDVRRTATSLQTLWNDLADAEWQFETQPGGPDTDKRVVLDGLYNRWREVEVHHTDLDLGYTSASWPAAYIAMDLPRLIESMPGRATPDAPRLMSWFLRDDTTGKAWIVSARGIRPGVGSATHTLHAPGHALLAWLFGREPSTPVRIERTNDEAVALALPRYFPFG
jgi:maleylpyruvate isomerase